MTLRAVDRGGSGVRGIHYVLPSWRSFRIYRGPFVIRRGTLFLVSAFDRAGNDEDFKQVRGLPGARVEPIALTKANREAGDANRAEGQLRAAVPAIEVYFVDHGGSYAGMTAEKLRAIDPLMTGIDVLSASRSAYCVRGRAGSVTLYKRGPAGEISRTPCH